MARSLDLGLACFALVVAAAGAMQFRVGGQEGWSVPDAGFEPYNTWAGRLRFQKGDQLLFVYPKETDSVLLVEPAAYNACNVSSYVSKFDDGNTVFTFDRSGPFFFISGNEANCRANEKLIVVVLADRSGARTPPGAPPATSPPSPAPLPSPSSTPPAAGPALSPSSPPPSSGAAPLPAPAATPTSPPSPAGSAPAPAPTTTPTSPPAPMAPSPTPTVSPSSPPAPMAPSPSTTPGGASQPPSSNTGGSSQPPSGSGSANAPSAEGNSTPPPPSADAKSAAAPVVAGLVGALGAFIGYAMLAA